MPSGQVTACVDQLRKMFEANRYEPLGVDTDPLVPILLKPLIDDLGNDCAIKHHGTDWDPADWRSHLRARQGAAGLLNAVDAVEKAVGSPIERRHLHPLADKDPLQLLVAVMAWGWGQRERGWRSAWRHAAKVVESNGQGDGQRGGEAHAPHPARSKR